ncbi:MAG: glycoside hydrolase N-terminal domain-containing protein [Clostridia bacterium]|nr:glycoside hydrolase N-terminal domain-containing protein [Clostridia bacterium]
MEKKIVNLYPASCWNDTTPVGNGVIAGSVYGCVYDERILINHEALYNWVCNVGYPDISYALAEVRRLMDEGRYLEANTYYTEEINKTGFRSNKGKFFPAFDIHILVDTEGAPENYRRELDMERGICTVSYSENGARCKRTVFASQAEKKLVVRLEKESAFGVKISLERHDMADYVDSFYADEFKSVAKDGYIYSESKTAGGLHFAGMVKVMETDGYISDGGADKALNIDMSGEAHLKEYIRIENATSITLLFDMSPTVVPFEELREKIDLCTSDYDTLKSEQESNFSALFNSTRLTLSQGESKSTEQLLLDCYAGEVGADLIEKMADFGRYLLISSSYGCEYPANLQGMWNGAYSPAWACTFFNNENIQMAYWQAYAGGLSKTALPLFNLYDRFKDDYRENAKNLFGCRGLLLPLFMDNSNGKKENTQPHVLYWTGSSAWISAIYYDYYLYTGDEDFLRERAYPFMKECALFYEDFMVYDQEGKLKSYPSNSPENRPDGDFEGAREVSVSINATMDFALLKELLTNLISASSRLGIDEEKRAEWQGMLRAIPEYEINSDGAIKEWMHPDFKDNYHHRHQSHIYPLFPGFEVSEESNRELFEAMRIAVEKRLVIGLKSQTGWSLAHMSNIFARLNQGDKAKECLDLLLRFCTGQNLYTYHNDWRNMGVTLKYMHAGHAPFQIDANMGFTSAVYEMLLYSDLDKIKLLPALPTALESGSIEGIHARGGFTVSIWWDKENVKAKITSDLGNSINVGIKGYTLDTVSPILAQSKYGDSFKLLTLGKGESIEFSYHR